MLKNNLIFALILCFSSLQGQEYRIVGIGFYNLENLFDTENDTLINDEDFLPNGSNHWTDDKYEEKLANMAYALSQIATDEIPTGLSLIGVSEIENRRVLEDLIAQPTLAGRAYAIAHTDSPDRRGIDVALLYRTDHFTVHRTVNNPVLLYDENGDRIYTRDVYQVEGELDGEPWTILINHWPSRRGGEEASAPRRMEAARINRRIVDSLAEVRPEMKVVVMGDLNDDPTSKSVVGVLRAAKKKRDARKLGLYNPMYDFYRRGLGSNAYRDNWSLFDQVIVSNNLLEDEEGYHFFKANVFNKKFLIQKSGAYKDYPFRTFSGNTYQGGYSDHFPVYALFIKAVNKRN